MTILHDIAKDEQGTTSIEYGAIASLISIVMIGALVAIGASVGDLFSKVPAF